MSAADCDPLFWLPALRKGALAADWSLTQWETVIRLSRRLRLLGRLAESLQVADVLDRVPALVARHLHAELRFSRARSDSLRWAVSRVAGVLAPAGYALVLLKGAAYMAQGLPIAAGRLPSDADVLVPRQHLADAQARLVAAGWEESSLDEHDRRYYHEWSHEVPPMRHPVLGLELDLHHNILPPIAHTHVDIELLLRRLQPSGWPGWQVFDPKDQVLHCAAHLFQDSDARDRLRDLVDLDGLLRHFGADAAFWSDLPDRAAQLGLSEQLALACHFSLHWLKTPLPDDVLRKIQLAGPSDWRRAWLHRMFAAVLTPTMPDEAPLWTQNLAAQVLLVRHHFRRMPLRILLPHLWHKLRRPGRSAVEDVLIADAPRKA